MTQLIQRMLVIAAVLSCVALVSAQGTGGAGGGQGRRGGGAGFGQRGQRGRGAGELQLAMRTDVQKELSVTDDQKTKLTDLRDKQRQAGGNRGGGAGAGGGQVDPAERAKRMAEMRIQQHKDLAAVLNETQMKRLGELVLQREGNNALTREEVQKALGFTSDQTAKIKDLQTKQQEANRALFEKMRNQELTQEELRDAMTKNGKTMNEELAKVLTSDQAAKFKSMQGAPFKFEETNGGG